MTKKTSEAPVIFVESILERMEGSVRKILLQTRWKQKTSPRYSGLLEIPGGHVNDHENIFEALQREVKEECGLNIKTCRNGFRGELFKINQFEQSMVFQSFVCQQVLSKNNGLWFGFVFLCEVEGELKTQEGETKDHRWVSIKKLEKLLEEQPEKFFPYQYQALKYYVDSIKRK